MVQIQDVHESDYRDTELGPIPLDWSVPTLATVADVILGQSPPSSTYNDDAQGLPFFQGKAEFGLRYPTVAKWCDTPERIGELGDVLISVRAPVGDVNISPYTCCIGRGLAAIRANENSHGQFIYYLLMHSKQRLEREGTGSTFKSINKSILANFPIPLPPLPEQRRIAAVLNTIQDEIAAQDDLIRALREFKRSAMARLFTYGAGETPAETKMTEVGEIPVGWKVRNISEIAKISGGGTPSTKVAKYWGGEIAWLTPSDVTAHHGLYIEHTNRSITPEGLEGSSAKLMPPGTVLMTSRATIGEAVICSVPMATNQGFINLITAPELLFNEYLAHWISWRKEYLIELGTGSTFLEVAKGVFRGISLPLPSLPDQRRIANVLNAIDDKIAAEEDRNSALQEFFRSMLQQLMTGHIRLLSDEGLPL